MKVEKIRQIVMQLWRDKNRVQSGFLAVYVGPDRRRFVIPTRFLKLDVMVGLLDKAEEEFGFPAHGGLVLPCDAPFFGEVLRLLERDETRFRRLGLQEFRNLVSLCGKKEGVMTLTQAFTLRFPRLGFDFGI